MASFHRGFILASLSVSVLALAACGTTGTNANMTNTAEANRVDIILERAAREARASGDTVETAALLEKIYQRNPDDPAIATSYGQALRENEQFTKARQIIQPFTEGKDAYPDAVMELAMVQLSLGQYKDAELTSRKAVELDPESGRAYLALGTALDAQNYHQQAEVAFRRGIDKWKGDPAPIMNNLALNLASQNKLDQAIDLLEKARDISPGRTEIERNIRIIRTLQEGADDFLTRKKEEPKKEGAAQPAKKPETKADNAKPVPAAKKAEEKPKAEAKKPAPKKEAESSENTNRRGSRQNFN